MTLQQEDSRDPTDSTGAGEALQNYAKVKQGIWAFKQASGSLWRSVTRGGNCLQKKAVPREGCTYEPLVVNLPAAGRMNGSILQGDLGLAAPHSTPGESGKNECKGLGYHLKYFAVRDFIIAANNRLFQILSHHHLLAS